MTAYWMLVYVFVHIFRFFSSLTPFWLSCLGLFYLLLVGIFKQVAAQPARSDVNVISSSVPRRPSQQACCYCSSPFEQYITWFMPATLHVLLYFLV